MKIVDPCLLLFCLGAGGCVPHTIQVNPVVVEPIQITVDVNIHEEAQASERDKPSTPADE